MSARRSDGSADRWRVGFWVAVASLAMCGPLDAQLDPSGSWRTWRTEHFYVHAQAHLEDLAVAAAQEAERAYALLAAELPAPRGPIDLVVADNIDAANGFATPFPSNRFAIYATPPSGTASLDDYDSWVRLVVTHELVHLFHLDRVGGVWNVLQKIFGRSPYLFPNLYQPSWVSEGIATYYESRLTTAGRVQGGFHRQLLAAAAQERWPAPNDVTGVSPAWPSGFRPYAWGAELFAQQRALHGDSVVPAFVRHTSNQLWPLAISGPLERAGGQALRAGWRELQNAAGRNPGAAVRGTIVERGLRIEPHPRVAPDGRLAYVRSDGRATERVVVRTRPDEPVVASHLVNGSPQLAWIGDMLYLAQLEFGSPVELFNDLYRWRPGGSWERVTSEARLDLPFALPDGGVGAVDLAARTRVLTRVRAGGAAAPLAAPPATGWARVAVSPDGQWFAGARHRDGRWDLVLWPADRPDAVRPITHDRALDEDPSWTPDGGMVVFASERDGIPQVYGYVLADETLVRLTDEPTGAREPDVTRDGVLIYSTVLADGFAVMRAPLGPGVSAVAPPRVAAPPVEAPPVEAPAVRVVAGGFDPWHALAPRFWIPFGHDESHSGFFVGGITAASDPIGRTRYGVAVTVSPDPLRWEALVALDHRRWRHTSLDLSLSQEWTGLVGRLSDGTLVPVGERERLVGTGVTVSTRRWRSFASLRLGGEIEQITFVGDDPNIRVTTPSIPALAGGIVSASVGRVTRPALAISPENGLVARGLYRRRWAVSDAGWGEEMQGSVTSYVALPLPGFAHWALALRVAGGRSGGPRATSFSLGGVSGDPLELVPGLAIGGRRRQFPMRGYPRTGAFTRVVSGAAELRVPIALVARGVWILPLVVDRISLTGFAEVGGGWTEGGAIDVDRLRDVGGELVLDLGVGYDVPMRARLGVAVPLRDGFSGTVRRGDAHWYVTFGPSF